MSDMSQSRRDDWQAEVLGELTGTPNPAARTGEPAPGQGPIPRHPDDATPGTPAQADGFGRFPGGREQADGQGQFPDGQGQFPAGQGQAGGPGGFPGGSGAHAHGDGQDRFPGGPGTPAQADGFGRFPGTPVQAGGQDQFFSGSGSPAQPGGQGQFPGGSAVPAQAGGRGSFSGGPGGQPQGGAQGRFPGAPGAPAQGADVPGARARSGVQPQGAPYGYPAAAPAGAPQGIRAPETVPVPATEAAGRPRHGDPAGRRALRALRGALGSSAARAVATETGLAAQVQQSVTTGRQIVVTSIRGGSGKTTVTALLSRTYNHYRHDPVLTLEADAALGTLPVRLGVESLRWTCGDLAQIVRPSMQLTDITGYLVPLADGGWLLPGSQGRIGAQVDVATYRTVMVALRRYFGVTVVDCETLPGEVARTALDTAHARVLTTPATAEGLVSTHAVLDWLASLPVPVLPRTVVVLTCQSPHPAIDLGKAAEKLRATGAGVVVLPYDRHLASGGAVRTELLGAETRQAAVRLAADVLQRALALPAAGAAR
ncbi:hypothetical protein SLAV_21145 [Streptomyces lavendulae subsp. lavendulae]|uniref:Uncharacterized protein n=1 Tax=Streptomyces lavendulae subsp. lavendulae TaxID=58340 RepID=A0A2K8PH54_STRLA|nr:hypothetical protein SLAV_21145 [Streptomyces lavendulae subsp. lavendulae]QUQ55878.1 hypothetical protein SLLC_19255 [Streptomyces lavendulae subsp. lavendulae]